MKFNVNTRKHFLTVRLFRHCDRLLRKVVYTNLRNSKLCGLCIEHQLKLMLHECVGWTKGSLCLKELKKYSAFGFV